MPWESELFDFRSYPYQKGALRLHLKSLTLRTTDISRDVEVPDGSVRVDLPGLDIDVATWEELDMGLLVERVASGDDPAHIQCLCESTRFERTLSPQQTGGPVEVHTIPIGMLRGTLLLRPLTTALSPEDAGLVTGDGKPVEILIDPAPEPFGGGLQTRWSKQFFVDRNVSNAMSWVDIPPTGEPTLYLNSGICDFQALLTSGGHSGPTARVRRLLLDMIEAKTWHTLGRYAAAHLYEPGDDGEEPTLTDESAADSWEASVLRRIATFMGPNTREEQAAGCLLDHNRHAEIRAHIDKAVAGRKGLRLRLEELAGDLGRGGTA